MSNPSPTTDRHAPPSMAPPAPTPLHLRLFGPPRSRRVRSTLHGESLSEQPQLETHGRSDIGRVRDANQDQYLIAELGRGLFVRSSSLAHDDGTTFVDSNQGWLFAVADGVGGCAAGDVASAIAIDTVAHYALTMMPWLVMVKDGSLDLVERGLDSALRRAQADMRSVAELRGIEPGMATTFTMAYVTWPDLFVVHVGDSRCYLERGGVLARLTRDHTMAEELIAQGVEPERVRGSRLSNILANVVGGMDPKLSLELHHLELRPGDHLLVCTDGVTGHLSDEELETRIAERRPVDEIVDGMVDAACRAGGQDNITAIVARF